MSVPASLGASLRGAKRADSVASGESLAPSGMTGLAASGKADAGMDMDFKDTVLFMQQQQVMQHKELLSALSAMSGKLDGVTSGGGGIAAALQPHTTASSPPPPPEGGASFYNEVGEYQYPATGTDYARQQINKTQGSTRNLVEDMQAAELRAARSRISDLEEQVRSLQKQLGSKEVAIQRLSSAALTSSNLKFSASDSVRRAELDHESARGGTPRTGALATGRGRDDGTSSVPFMLTPSKAIDEHERSVKKLNTMGVSPISPGVSALGPHLTNLDQSISTSAEIQARLKEHQHRCQLLTKR